MTDHSNELVHWHRPFLVRSIVRIVALAWRWHDDRVGQRPLLGRFTSHVALVLMLLFLVVLGSLSLDSLSAVVNVADQTILAGFVQSVDAAPSTEVVTGSPYTSVAAQARIARQAQVHTAIPERPRLEVISYTVQAGDTAEKIADAYGLLPTTLLWSNPEMEKMPDLLNVGQVLTILPIDGVYHTVAPSDTLESLAETYKVDVSAITGCPFNTIPTDGLLIEGASVIVPGGTKPYLAREVTTYAGPVPDTTQSSGVFAWPASGVLTQGYWYAHRAIDIGGFVGSAIRASDGGYVSFAGWTDIGYGYLVVLNHENNYQTYYAHLSDIYVYEGQSVSAGDVIGAMGSTGNSTGPHLHFEVRYDGYPTNPLIYLW
jgi:murein DD-endopeptidase MepM/ murein hydrolase activator NlpD